MVISKKGERERRGQRAVGEGCWEKEKRREWGRERDKTGREERERGEIKRVDREG